MVSGASPRGGGVEDLLVPVLVSVPLFGLLLAAHAWIEASIFAGAAVLTATTRAILARRDVTVDWQAFRGRGRSSVPIDLRSGSSAIALIESGPHARRLARLERVSGGWRVTIPATRRSQRVRFDEMSLDALERLRDDWQMRFLLRGRVFERAMHVLAFLEGESVDESPLTSGGWRLPTRGRASSCSRTKARRD